MGIGIDVYYWAGTGQQEGTYFALIPSSTLERVIGVIEDKKGARDWHIEAVGMELFTAAIALSLSEPPEFLGTSDYQLKPINGSPPGIIGRKLTPEEARKGLIPEILDALSGK